MGVLGEIFYIHNVVGEVVIHAGVIYGARIHRTFALQHVHEHLQLYKLNNYIYVTVIIYVYIRTHRWLYVVITTKVIYGDTMRL